MDQGAFLDLTPYVTGDAVKEFPNIATFPEVVWNNVMFKGKIYGVPKPIQLNGNTPFYRGDWAQKLNIQTPKNADEVHNLLVSFSKNDPDGNGQGDTWGMGQFGDWSNQLIFPMFGVPYNWRLNDDGTMVYQIETPEYKQAIEFLRKLWDDGGFHPDSASMNFTQAQEAFIGGKTGLHMEGFGSFFGRTGLESRVKTTTPTADLVGLLQPGHDGGKGVTYNTIGSFGITAIPVTVGNDDAKIKELLHILDYLASPFGTEEQFFLANGLEGVHHTMEDGVPILTEQGRADIGDLVYTMGPLPYFFYPGVPEHAEEAQRLATQAMQQGINDPTWGLYSAANVAKGSELNQLVRDRTGSLVTGREPLTGLDDFIAQWRSRGGDEIRREYEQAVKERGA
jgi:putative aldouronate transport system substrate-binding protein